MSYVIVKQLLNANIAMLQLCVMNCYTPAGRRHTVTSRVYFAITSLPRLLHPAACGRLKSYVRR